MVLYGQPVADKIYENLKKQINQLNQKPGLAVVLVGENPASLLYVGKKQEKAQELGIDFKLYHFPSIVPEKDVLTLINKLNQDKNIHGILVQLPLPQSISTDKVLKEIEPKKDIERVSPAALAILEILKYYKIDLKNKKIVLVGRGKLVGAPLEKILCGSGLETQVCDSKTPDLKSQTLSADIIISAVGEPGLITAEMISEKAIMIDAGTAESGGKTIGDVEKSVYEKVSAYSPVPGGVGPVTVATLYKNLIEAAENE